MAVAQAQATRCITAQESLELVRCLLRVSVFHVTALRGLFPEDCYREITMKNLDGMTIKVLNPVNDESKRLIDWVDSGVLDAVKKGYLKQMVFGISSNVENTDLLEEFVYNFSYGPNGSLRMTLDKVDTDVKGHKTNASAGNVEVPANGNKNQINVVKYQVTRLMRMLVQLCRTLEQVPKERYLFCRLTYHDHTPDEYEPNLFRPLDAAEQARTSRFSRKPFSMHVGSLVTDDHQVSLRVKSVLDSCGDEGEGDDVEDQGSQGSGMLATEDKHHAAAAEHEDQVMSQAVSKQALPRQRAHADLNGLADNEEHEAAEQQQQQQQEQQQEQQEEEAALPARAAATHKQQQQRPSSAPAAAACEPEAEAAADNFQGGDAMSDDDITERPDNHHNHHNHQGMDQDPSGYEEAKAFCVRLSKVDVEDLMCQFPRLTAADALSCLRRLRDEGVLQESRGKNQFAVVAAKAGRAEEGDADRALVSNMSGLLVGKQRSPKSRNASSFMGGVHVEGSDMTGSPSKGHPRAAPAPAPPRKSKRASEALHESHDHNVPMSQNPPTVYYEGSQHSGQKAVKRSKTSVVSEPIHQVAREPKKPPVSPKRAAGGGGRTRLSRMRG